MPLSEYVYCVVTTFKMTEQGEQWICIKFFIKLEHSSTETTWMIQKATAMGNCDWQLHSVTHPLMHCILCPVFWWNIKSPRWLRPHTAQNSWPATSGFFTKLKSPLKGKRFQTISEIQENMMGQLMAIGRSVWVPKVPTLKGTEAPLSSVQCSLYLVSPSINASSIHIT